MACPPLAKKPRLDKASTKLVAKVVEYATPKSMKVATSFSVAVFKSFCEEKDVDNNLETCTVV